MPVVSSNDDKSARTTVIMPEALSMNLDLFCLHSRQGRGEVIRQAVREFLTRHEYKPDQIPQISHSWLPPASRNKNGQTRASSR